MTEAQLHTLKPGQLYNVKIRGGRRHVHRVFKWPETRFDSILCAVFTSQVRGPLTVEVLGKDCLRFTGKAPASEVSVPHYDLISCVPIDRHRATDVGSPDA